MQYVQDTRQDNITGVSCNGPVCSNQCWSQHFHDVCLLYQLSIIYLLIIGEVHKDHHCLSSFLTVLGLPKWILGLHVMRSYRRPSIILTRSLLTLLVQVFEGISLHLLHVLTVISRHFLSGIVGNLLIRWSCYVSCLYSFIIYNCCPYISPCTLQFCPYEFCYTYVLTCRYLWLTSCVYARFLFVCSLVVIQHYAACLIGKLSCDVFLLTLLTCFYNRILWILSCI